jgi:hypothetical protein
MGFSDFLKKIFSPGDDDDAELRAARARHGITVDEKVDTRAKDKDEPEKEPYDPWEEVSNARTNFFFGSWASKKFRIVGEDKVKAELEALEKKRQEEDEKKGK